MRNHIVSFRQQADRWDLLMSLTERQVLADIQARLEQAQEYILDRDAEKFVLNADQQSEKLRTLLAQIEPVTSGSGSAQQILEMIRARSRESK
jgi:mevalonate pyrophosphate decarboxylase